MIRQISVFVENQPGSMMNVTNVLTEAHVNIRAISTFDTPEFGIMRLVVDDPVRAKESLTSKGFVNRVSDVIGAELKDEKGNLNQMLKILADGQINITGETIVTIVSCLIIMAGLMLFINKTKAGQAMLAVSEDKGAAQLMGINVDGTIALTFAIGSGLAAVAGVLLCSAYPSLTPYTGSMPGIKAFVAAVFGGIGSIPGALVGGILLGIIEIFGKAYISSQMADAIVFAVLIVVLLVRPAGLFGKNIQEKV